MLACSALNQIGISEIWASVEAFTAAVTADGELAEARSQQATAWLWSEIGDTLLERFCADPRVMALLPTIEADVASGQVTPAKAASMLLQTFADTVPS